MIPLFCIIKQKKDKIVAPPERKPEEINDYDAMPFTPSERKAIREMLESQKRVEWLWSTIRVWAMWITAIAAAIVVLKDWLKVFMKG